MIRFAAALLATTALAVPAFAADFDLAPIDAMSYAPAAATTDWTGFYVGIFGGGTFNPAEPGVLEIDEDLDGNFDEPLVGLLGPAFGPNFTGSHDGGFIVGAEAGYDMQFDQFVVGGVIDIAHVDYQDRQSAFSNTPAAYTQLTDLDLLGTVRARAGYLVTDDVLAYVHGGLAVADTNVSFVTTNPNGTSRGGNDLSVGYQVGAGVEAKVGQGWSLGVEYAYTNLGDTDFTTRFTGGPAFVDQNPDGGDLRGTDETFDFHTVKASLKYRF